MKKLIALVLAVVCVFGLVGCEFNFKKEKLLMEKGPWASEAIWVDENSQMYLICTKNSEDIFAAVQAFLFVEGQWQAYQLHLNQGAPIVSFTTFDGERILEARAKMNDKNLYLYDFKIYEENFVQQYVYVELSKFSYKDQVDKLPFEIN